MDGSVAGKILVAEQEINRAYEHNALTVVDRSTAIWTILSCAEDMSIRPAVQGRSLSAQQSRALADHIINAVRYPLRWLSPNISKGKVRFAYNGTLYFAGQEMLELALNYEYFACAFRYMHHKVIELAISGCTLSEVGGGGGLHPEYEAYGFLSTLHEEKLGDAKTFELWNEIDSRVRVRNERFNCHLNPTYVRKFMADSRRFVFERFQLPFESRLSRYTLGEFAEVFLTLFALCSINYYGRIAAIERGCIDLAIADSILIQPVGDLIRRVARYSDLTLDVVRSVLEDLTYGNGGINFPDPVIQPLIPLDDGIVAIMPTIILTSAAERNFCVLLNRLGHQRESYRHLTTQKEQLMRDQILGPIGHCGFRTWSGKNIRPKGLTRC